VPRSYYSCYQLYSFTGILSSSLLFLGQSELYHIVLLTTPLNRGNLENERTQKRHILHASTAKWIGLKVLNTSHFLPIVSSGDAALLLLLLSRSCNVLVRDQNVKAE
jgi:hypothetical protein